MSDLEDLDKLKERTRQISVAGMMTQVEHRTSQNGKPYGRFTLEDYNGSHQFMLFSKDYIRLRNFINADWFVFLEADVVYNDYRSRTELKINNITLLAEVVDVKAKALQIDLNMQELDETTVEDLVNILDEGTGKLGVKFRLFDSESKISLRSRKRGISIDKALSDRLEMMDGIKARLI